MKIMSSVMVILGLCVLSTGANGMNAGNSAGQRMVSPLKAKLERGYDLLRANKNIEAMAVFSSVLKADPSNHAALIELGYLNARLKRYNSVLKFLRAASAQDPENMRLHMDMGYVMESLKDANGAAYEFELVAKEPGEFRSQAQTALKMMKESSAAVVKTPVNSKQKKLLEQGYAALRSGDNTMARRSFEAALKNDPQNTAILKQLGYLSLQEGNLISASEKFETARHQEPNDAFVALQLGYIYGRLNKKEQAAAAFKFAMASPDAKVSAAAEAALKPAAAAPSPGVEQGSVPTVQ